MNNIITPESDSEDELPPGWEERATTEGQVYYANHFRQSTQWTHPRTGKKKTVSGALPFGWERRHLPDDKILYVNHQEQKTSYVDPRLAFAKEVQENEKDCLKDFRQRFDASSNALQVLHGQDLSHKIAVVTGANSGIGYETTRSLARAGCTVILACRDLVKAQASIDLIQKERPMHVKCRALHLDLRSLDSVKTFVQRFAQQYEKCDILILNAGIFGCTPELTPDDLEVTFQVNYLSHFYLSHLLKPYLMKSSLPKIVVVSSESHRFSLQDYSLSSIGQGQGLAGIATHAYNDSKLFALMFALHANNEWRSEGIRCIAVHPGNMVASNLTRHWWLYKLLFNLVRPFMKSLQQAAASVIFAAAAPEMNFAGGIYINNCFPCQPSDAAQDQVGQRKLWEASVKLLHDRGHKV